MWKWKEVEFATYEVAFESFYGSHGNNEKLWAPTSQKIQKKMQRALRLLLAHVDWFAEQPLTCHECHAFLAGQMIRPVDPVSRGDILFAEEWTLAASQHATNDTTSSILALPMEGIRRDSHQRRRLIEAKSGHGARGLRFVRQGGVAPRLLTINHCTWLNPTDRKSVVFNHGGHG